MTEALMDKLYDWRDSNISFDEIEAIINQLIKAHVSEEREACAKVVEAEAWPSRKDIAAAIRGRK